MRISIQLPFFPGFYETAYKNSDTAYYAIREELEYYHRDLKDEHPEYQLLTEDDLDFDDEEYERDVMNAFIEVWAKHAPDFVKSVEFDELDSPRYYNFRNDHLYAYVELADEWKDEMRQFIASNYDWLQERIHDDWTSYDGFISFMENDIDEWDKNLFEAEDPRYIGTMIAYMMQLANETVYDDILMSVFEDIYEGMYVFIIPEAEERIQKAIDTGEVKIPDPAQLEIPFK